MKQISGKHPHGNGRLVLASAIGLAALAAVPGSAVASVDVSAAGSTAPAPLPVAQYVTQYDCILGTSMDLLVLADKPHQAEAAEQAALAEIDRLCAILSTYSPASEINAHMAAAPVQSPELAEMLSAYETWHQRTGGAIDINTGAVKALWKSAEQNGRVPRPAELAEARASTNAFNVDALGKGYVIDQVVAKLRQIVPAGLLNIGGDLRAWGPAEFLIHVANPFQPAENAHPVATVRLQESAVATSGGYARNIVINGQRLTHIIDPRTSQPVEAFASATVVARDCLTANALSTAACVLGDDVLPMFDEHADGFALVGLDGDVTVGGGMCAVPPAQPLAADAGVWPKDFQVAINLNLKVPAGGRYKRPYVAVWIEDANGKAVRTVTLIGNRDKYIREMTDWWKATAGDRELIKTSRATRDPGKFTVVWDGLDDKGKPLPTGKYNVVIEVNREHGRHVTEEVKLECGDNKAEGKSLANAEAEECTVVYGPKPPKGK